MSTEAVAFSLFVGGKLKKYGTLKMTGGVQKRNYQANRFGTQLGKMLEPDLIAYESAVYIQNKRTVITLAEFFGAVVSSMSGPTTQVRKFIPVEWQNWIGNKALTKAEKEQIKKQTPGKSVSWYKNAGRELRKQRTMDWVNNKFNLDIDDDDISDAIAIGWTATTKPVL
jgi:Holliday junction resolvasome RuvABC endonuclease subunit